MLRHVRFQILDVFHRAHPEKRLENVEQGVLADAEMQGGGLDRGGGQIAADIPVRLLEKPHSSAHVRQAVILLPQKAEQGNEQGRGGHGIFQLQAGESFAAQAQMEFLQRQGKNGFQRQGRKVRFRPTELKPPEIPAGACTQIFKGLLGGIKEESSAGMQKKAFILQHQPSLSSQRCGKNQAVRNRIMPDVVVSVRENMKNGIHHGGGKGRPLLADAEIQLFHMRSFLKMTYPVLVCTFPQKRKNNII